MGEFRLKPLPHLRTFSQNTVANTVANIFFVLWTQKNVHNIRLGWLKLKDKKSVHNIFLSITDDVA